MLSGSEILLESSVKRKKRNLSITGWDGHSEIQCEEHWKLWLNASISTQALGDCEQVKSTSLRWFFSPVNRINDSIT